MIRSIQDQVHDWMLRKFEKGQKKYGETWKDVDPDYMWRRMEEEMMEFRQAVEHDRDFKQAIKELADMVNFGIFFVVLSLRGDDIED